ncbi:glycosyltransferase family 2 protein [Candidatus Methylospira mobilis]|uniref:Glycosyltransferase family 2 protein n=1 Tax=Candidatus Methylospira mobilis TaxID=1808979 RepID=A0A5Q0BQ05_9GAMM|nr:glycosyltransferase family 2 protein [Candidatus Methylospira mobilis]QFY44167.1 glycosyltransferase family 2 protein [Candidatus Methylospira mobilis]WNV06413.1 glycosyltransferase family 2 protein [Candidatus Methylospira mobilis]
MKKLNVVAVAVTYNPEIRELERLLAQLIRQVSEVIIVDNASANAALLRDTETSTAKALHWVFLQENCGIAAAHNTGIAEARRLGASHIALFDQDSEPADDMVSCLLAALERLEGMGHSVACVGPRYLDERQDNPPPFIRVSGLHLQRCACAHGDDIVAVDYLISSGSLIPMSALDKTGGMRSDFFIDYVDIEWGMRASSQGLQSYGVCAAGMRHNLGSQPLEFLGRKIPLHSPLRHYYHFRNAVLLYKEPWVRWNWKLVDGWRLCLKYIFYSLFARPRMAHWHKMTLGVWHGLLGKTGRFDGKT